MPTHRSTLRCPALALLTLFALAGAGCDRVKGMAMKVAGEDPADKAKKRVEFILGTAQSEGHKTSTALQTAICRFDQDEAIIERDQIEPAYDAFEAWRTAGGFSSGIQSFEINPEVRYATAEDPPNTFYIQVTINHTPRWLRVPPKARISWAG